MAEVDSKTNRSISTNSSLEMETEKTMGTYIKAPDFQLTAGSAGGPIQRKSKDKTKEFQSKKYSKPNFKPSTGYGLFDVNLNPFSGRLEIRLKVGFSFSDGDSSKFKGLKGQNEKWGKEEKKQWKSDFITLIEGRWGGKFLFSNPDLPGTSVYVDVEIEEVEKDWHFGLSVKKIPKGTVKQSNTGVGGFTTLNKYKSNLDSEDTQWADKNAPGAKPKIEKQMGALHEFGHMIGLDDEYDNSDPGVDHAALVKDALGKTISEGNTDNIMSLGNHIEKRNYVTFLEALKSVSGMDNWVFTA